MEAMIYVLGGCVVFQSLALLGFLAWRESQHKKQIDELTSKIVARTLPEYAQAQKTLQPEVKVKPQPAGKVKLIDPVMGAVYVDANQ